MTEKFKNPKVAIATAVGAGLLILVAGWFLLVSPQRAKSTELQKQIDTTQSSIATRRAALASKPKITVSTRSSDLFRLTKSVPDKTDMPGLMIELDRLAHATGVTFTAMNPSTAVTGLGYNVQPLSVVVQGRYTAVGAFLKKLRKQVTVHKGALKAHGRLFAVDSLELGQPESGQFPLVRAALTLDAFVYAGGSAPATGAPGAGSDTTTGTSPSGAVAAGATG